MIFLVYWLYAADLLVKLSDNNQITYSVADTGISSILVIFTHKIT